MSGLGRLCSIKHQLKGLQRVLRPPVEPTARSRLSNLLGNFMLGAIAEVKRSQNSRKFGSKVAPNIAEHVGLSLLVPPVEERPSIPVFRVSRLPVRLEFRCGSQHLCHNYCLHINLH